MFVWLLTPPLPHPRESNKGLYSTGGPYYHDLMQERKDMGQGSSGIGLEGYSTAEIYRELKARLGVTTFERYAIEDKLTIFINGELTHTQMGPFGVMVNID